jgi:hypothetical protein
MIIDFVTQLPTSKDPVIGYAYNLIFIIVNRLNVFHQWAPHPSKRPIDTANTTAQRQREMSQQHQLKKTYSEADVQLAISNIQT